MSFEIKEGTPIIGSYYFGDEIKTGIGFIKYCDKTPYAYLALKDGGVTCQQLFSLREYKKIPFAVDQTGSLIQLD